MNTIQVFLYRNGSLNPADKAALKSAGYLPIGVADINDVALLFPDGAKLKGDAIFMAAIKAISGPNSDSERQKFAAAIIASIDSIKK